MKKLTGAKTALEKAVQKSINELAEDYPDTGVAGVIEDLMQGGCASGMVPELVYYRDTDIFYKRHIEEINALLANTLADTGCSCPADLFGDKWCQRDPLARLVTNVNLLAWFGYEETAQALANRNGIEV